jgi:MFS family permease
VAAVCIGAFMGQLDASIVTVALPSIRSDLGVSLGAVEWVSLAYLLALVGTVSAMGRIADMVGRKLLYVYGFIAFAAASLACGLAGSLAVLLVMRSLQGVGAAMLQANSVALIRTTVPDARLHQAIGLQGAAQAIGLALGPAAGGVLVELAGWRWVFYVNVPVGIVGAALGVLLLPRTRIRAPRTRFDWSGLATLLPASAALLLALSLHKPWLVAAAAVLAIVFVLIERHVAAPLIDLALFRSRRFAAAIVSGLLAYLVLFGTLLAVPLHLHSAATAGAVLTALPIALGVTAAFAIRGSTVGLVLLCAACAGMAFVPLAGLVVLLAVAGIGLGLFTPANNAAIAGSGQEEHAGMVSGVLNMTRGIGTALGIAVAGLAYAHGGFSVTMPVLAGLAGLAALIGIVGGA